MAKSYSSMPTATLVGRGFETMQQGKKMSIRLAMHILDRHDAKYHDRAVYDEALRISNKYWNDPRVKRRIAKNIQVTKEARDRIRKMLSDKQKERIRKMSISVKL